jgi:hypothetical protein
MAADVSPIAESVGLISVAYAGWRVTWHSGCESLLTCTRGFTMASLKSPMTWRDFIGGVHVMHC